MGADGGDPQVRLVRERSEFAPQLDDVLARVRDRSANLRAQLDHRLVHLRLDLLLEQDFAALEDFLNVGTQFTRLRVDDREFLLDPERERMVRGGHGWVTNVSQKLRAVMRGN